MKTRMSTRVANTIRNTRHPGHTVSVEKVDDNKYIAVVDVDKTTSIEYDCEMLAPSVCCIKETRVVKTEHTIMETDTSEVILRVTMEDETNG